MFVFTPILLFILKIEIPAKKIYSNLFLFTDHMHCDYIFLPLLRQFYS